jgi:hypothetical protein
MEEEGLAWGVFGKLPKDLRIWFFSRFHPRVLPRFRLNKTFKEFIESKVFFNITRELHRCIRGNWVITPEVWCKECECCSMQGGGVVKKYTHQPTGTPMGTRLDNTIIMFRKEGWCYWCVLMKGLPPPKNKKRPKEIDRIEP